MALKLGYSSRLQSEPSKSSDQSNQAPGLVRALSGLGTSALGFAGNLAQYPQDLFSSIGKSINEKYEGGDENAPRLPWQKPGSYKETHKETKGGENPLTTGGLRNQLSEATGYSRESLEPKGTIEKGANFLAGETVPFAFSGGFKGLPQAINAGKTLLGLHAGSNVGRGGAKLLGAGTIGQEIGSLAGGLGGATLAHNIGSPRLSKQLFAKDKNQRMKLAKESHGQLEKEISNLESERTKNYALAEKEGKLINAFAPEVKEALTATESAINHGVLPDESKKILTILQQLDQEMGKGSLNLETAKTFKKNLNSAIYDRNLPTTVKKYYGDINRGLNKFIANIGEKYPEHGKPFALAEEQTKQLAKLKEIHKAADVDKLFKNISKEKYSDFINNVFEEQGLAVDDAIANTKLNLSDAAISGLSYAIGGLPGKILGGAKALHKVGKIASHEYQSVKNIIKHNPSLGKELSTAVKAAAKKDYPLFISSMTKVDREMSSKMPKKEPKKQSALKLGY